MRAVRKGGGAGDCQECIGKGGLPPPPPLGTPSLRPATVPLTASARFSGICNRQ